MHFQITVQVAPGIQHTIGVRALRAKDATEALLEEMREQYPGSAPRILQCTKEGKR